MNKAFSDIDSYIAAQPEEDRTALEQLRQIIRSAAPGAEELISYSMPAFRHHGMLAGFMNAKKHYGFYPWNGRTVTAFEDDLKDYVTSKGAIQLPKSRPLPVALIKKIVRYRVKENEEQNKNT